MPPPADFSVGDLVEKLVYKRRVNVRRHLPVADGYAREFQWQLQAQASHQQRAPVGCQFVAVAELLIIFHLLTLLLLREFGQRNPYPGRSA